MYWDGSRANLEGAETASRKALALAPEIAEAHASRGFALTLERDYEGARQEFETAIRLNPKLYEAHYLYARAHMQAGNLEEAVRQFEEAAQVRPEDYQAMLLCASPLNGLRRTEAAKATLRRGLTVVEKHLELNPDDARALYLGAQALIQLGDRDRALEWAGRARSANESDSLVLYNVACVYALGALVDETIECLDKAIQNGFGHREWIEHDSDLNGLRDDPRFQSLLKRM